MRINVTSVLVDDQDKGQLGSYASPKPSNRPRFAVRFPLGNSVT